MSIGLRYGIGSDLEKTAKLDHLDRSDFYGGSLHGIARRQGVGAAKRVAQFHGSRESRIALQLMEIHGKGVKKRTTPHTTDPQLGGSAWGKEVHNRLVSGQAAFHPEELKDLHSVIQERHDASQAKEEKASVLTRWAHRRQREGYGERAQHISSMGKEALFDRKKKWEAISGMAPTHKDSLSVNSASRQSFEHMHRPQAPLTKPRSKFRPTGKQLAAGTGIAAAGYGVHRLLKARRKAKQQYEAPLRQHPPQPAQQPQQPMRPKLAFIEVTEALDFEKTAALLADGEAAAQEILRGLPCWS